MLTKSHIRVSIVTLAVSGLLVYGYLRQRDSPGAVNHSLAFQPPPSGGNMPGNMPTGATDPHQRMPMPMPHGGIPVPQTQPPPVTVGAIKIEVDGWNADTCNKAVRVKTYRDVCDRNPVHHEKPTLAFIMMDHQAKTVGCLSYKVGTLGWRRFLHYSPHRTRVEIRYGVPLSSFEKAYGNYTKYIVVRHPLQRLVSAYYEEIVLKKLFPKSDGSKMNFSEFAHRLVRGHWKNKHWREYNMNCHMCDIDYDYVLKQETLEQDTSVLRDLLGFPNEIKHDHIGIYQSSAGRNTSRGIDHIMHKYDKILADIENDHPPIMEKLINMYKYDMELFDYGWDRLNAESICLKNVSGFACC